MAKKLDELEAVAKPREGKRKAFIAFVLDESGSMQTGKAATISGMNEQIQQIKLNFKDSKDVEPIITFVKFNGNVTPLYENKTLAELKEFSNEDYQPNGSTAMYDGIGYVLNVLENAAGIEDEDTSVLVVVVSDGQNTDINEHTPESIAERVKKFNETKRWTFTYLGSNVDLTEVSARSGVLRGNMASFNSSSSMGYTQAFDTHNIAFASYLGGVKTRASKGLMADSVDDFYASSSESKTESSSAVAGTSESKSGSAEAVTK